LEQGGQKVSEDVKDRIQNYMVGAGSNEVMTYSFIHADNFDKLKLAPDDYRRKAVTIMNPLSDEFKTMRTTMLPSILKTAAYNLARQNTQLSIFEVARVFLPKALPLTDFPEEKTMMCVALSGRRNNLQWSMSKDNVDFYDMKGILEGLMEELQITDYKLVPTTEPFLHPGTSCNIELEGKVIGFFGGLHPDVQKAFALDSETYVLEMAVEPLEAKATVVPHYKPVPQFPSTSRDIAVVVPREVSCEELEAVIRKYAGRHLTDIKLFDVYTGKQVAAGNKSMAFNLTFQDKEKTLKDEDIDAVIKKVVEQVGDSFKATLRE